MPKFLQRLFQPRPRRTVSVIPHGDDQFSWHAKAPNGEITCSGEGYTRLEDAERAARDLCRSRFVFDERSPAQARVLSKLGRKP